MGTDFVKYVNLWKIICIILENFTEAPYDRTHVFKIFRLWGEPVNLREQHDALEFFNSLVDSMDEALKTLGNQTICSKVLAGSFADQKICKDCPHRYVRNNLAI